MSSSRVESTSGSLQWSAWTDRGKIRANNEDSFLGLQFDGKEIHRLGKHGEAPIANMDFAFAVSDGMGGAMAGEFASRIAVEKITTLLPRSFQHAAAGLQTGFEDILTELFGEIHYALAYVGSCYEECFGMETTLTLGWFTPGWMYFAHIGDTRLYYLPAGGKSLKQLSHDDTHVGWLFRNGKINDREARTHPRRHVLQKALGGSNQFVEPQLGAVGYEPGDIFLLCSDGLTDGLYDKQLLETLRKNPNRKKNINTARALVSAAVEHSGRDNTTALVIRAC